MNAVKTRYEFGRHETFALREGWLDKGLSRLVTHPEGYRPDLETADELGIGSRMAKSLTYWLEAAGLGFRVREGRVTSLWSTKFGDAVSRLDPRFDYPGTTWFVHLMFARRPGSVWNWFFNDFRNQSFLREGCIDEFSRAIREHSTNQTTPGVIQREIACLLNTYAALPPSEPVDPEDPTVSPMRALGLVLRHHDTDRFEKTCPLDSVPLEAFLASVVFLAWDRGSTTLPLTDLIALRNSPGRLFNLDGDMVSEAAQAAAEAYAKEGVRLSLHGATRTITVPEDIAETWYERHFARIEAR